MHLMSWKGQHRKDYEARVLADSLARLAKRVVLKTLPFSEEELQTLARRARESFRSSRSEAKRERLAGYKAHLSGLYGQERTDLVWGALEAINNEIGFEEK